MRELVDVEGEVLSKLVHGTPPAPRNDPPAASPHVVTTTHHHLHLELSPPARSKTFNAEIIAAEQQASTTTWHLSARFQPGNIIL